MRATDLSVELRVEPSYLTRRTLPMLGIRGVVTNLTRRTLDGSFPSFWSTASLP